MAKAIEKDEWTQIIKPKNKWYDINLKEIWDYRDLLFLFVKRNISTIYKQTVLGPVWFLFGPLFTVFTYTFVFSEIAKISTDGLPAPVFYLAGTILWGYFDACFNGASATFTVNAAMFGKVYFPRLIPPLALVISNLLKMFLQFIVFLIFVIYHAYTGDVVQPNKYIILTPLLWLIMALMSFGIGIIITSLTTKYRDVKQFIGVIVTLLMYASPVIYPTSSVPEVYKPFLSINPIVPVVDSFRYAYTSAGSPIEWSGLLYSSIVTIVILVIGLIAFNGVERKFIDNI